MLWEKSKQFLLFQRILSSNILTSYKEVCDWNFIPTFNLHSTSKVTDEETLRSFRTKQSKDFLRYALFTTKVKLLQMVVFSVVNVWTEVVLLRVLPLNNQTTSEFAGRKPNSTQHVAWTISFSVLALSVTEICGCPVPQENSFLSHTLCRSNNRSATFYKIMT